MQAYIFALQTDAQSFQAKCDQVLGYPKPGVDIGGGTHVPPAESVTTHEADVRKHPTLSQWAHQSTPNVDGALATVKAGLPGLTVTAPVTLDSTWDVKGV